MVVIFMAIFKNEIIMARVKIKFPANNPLHTCTIAVRISDINYGNHLGNDSVLSILHEARMQWLAKHNFTELDAGGNSLIMGDVMIAYKGEAYYGEQLQVTLFVDEITERSFDLLYRINTMRHGQWIDIAHAKTGMVCYDYSTRKVAMILQGLKTCIS